MNDQEINIAIAEACGWIHNTGEEPSYGGTYRQAGWTSPEWVFASSIWSAKTSSGLPDYCNDLNAMHEAERLLTQWEEMESYHSWLGYCGENNTSELHNCIHSTARQRAEAFLRVIGKWKEAEK